MNKEKASKLWKIIQEAGDYLVGQLPDHPNHPKGRNPYAHVAICVKIYYVNSCRALKCIMNKENASKLWKIIQEAGDYLGGQLPDHPNHPKGRNAYAHVAICVKSKFNASYKDIPDEKFEEILEYIKFLKQNPN